MQFQWNGETFVPAQTRIAIVSFATGRYLRYEADLRASVQTHCPEATLFVFHDPVEIGSPSHEESPYSFKVHAIETVRAKGYDVVLWVDSIIRFQASIAPLLEILETRGVYLQSDGWPVGAWANDRSLAYFGVSRNAAMFLTNIHAAIMAFDFRVPVAQEFLRRWKKASDDGIFCGVWTNGEKTESQDERCRGHRHDQTCAELISYALGISHGPSLIGTLCRTH